MKSITGQRNQTAEIINNMPACVEEKVDPSGPMGAGQAGSPRVAAGRRSSTMGGLVQAHQDHSRGHPPWVELHSSSRGPSARSTSPHGCSRGDTVGEDDSGRREAEKMQKIREEKC